MKQFYLVVFIGLFKLFLACAHAGVPPIWVSAWADAPDSAGGPASSEQSFREIVKPTVGSRGIVRLHFSNYFGDHPVRLGAVHIGLQTSGASVDRDVPVTFGGAATITIPAGGFVTSDQLRFAFTYGSTLAVTEYVSGSWDRLTRHIQAGSGVTSYATARDAGDKTSDLAGTSFTSEIFGTYLLNRVDVFGDYKETIAAFGSSTTDGVNSGRDRHKTYPEHLASLLHAAGRDDVAIANVGISGNEVLRSAGGPAGVIRFERDVVNLPGVTAVVDYLGANDLRNSCVPADSLIAGTQNLISMAHAAGLKIYVGTTAPSTFCRGQNPRGYGTRFPQGSGQEAQRLLVNHWLISTQPSTVNGVAEQPPAADAIIRFDTALADPANTSYMLSRFNSGDDIHPNAAGYRAMAEAIPLGLF